MENNELMQQWRTDERCGQVPGALKPNTCELLAVKDCYVAEKIVMWQRLVHWEIRASHSREASERRC